MEHWWWNKVMKQCNSNGGTVWGKSGTVRWNSVMDTVVEQGDSDGRTMGESLLNCVVEQWNSHGEKV